MSNEKKESLYIKKTSNLQELLIPNDYQKASIDNGLVVAIKGWLSPDDKNETVTITNKTTGKATVYYKYQLACKHPNKEVHKQAKVLQSNVYVGVLSEDELTNIFAKDASAYVAIVIRTDSYKKKGSDTVYDSESIGMKLTEKDGKQYKNFSIFTNKSNVFSAFPEPEPFAYVVVQPVVASTNSNPDPFA
jgi:hypothetical protein